MCSPHRLLTLIVAFALFVPITVAQSPAQGAPRLSIWASTLAQHPSLTVLYANPLYKASPLAAPERMTPQPLAWLGYVAEGDSLPDGMYLKERILWGERGLVRMLNLAPTYRRSELKMRRRWLQRHQQLGLITLAGLTGQVVLGELLAANKGPYSDYQSIHKYLGYGTFTAYMVTASFAIFAPPGRRYSGGVSSIRIHRWLAVIHFAGMLAQPFLGIRTAEASTFEDYRSSLNAHKWVGRVTYGAYLAAITTTLFQ